MTYTLFDYVDAHGRNRIKEWSESLQKVQRAKLNAVLDKLQLHGDSLYPQMLTDTPLRGIMKLRVHGNVQLRPLLCRGPVSATAEYTLLLGAKEIGGRWSPAGAPETAKQHRDDVSADPDHRRKHHERVS